MRSRSLPRSLLQAGLLIGVGAIAALLHLDAWAIVLVVAAALGKCLMTRKAGAASVPELIVSA